MSVNDDYLPSPAQWVRDQVQEYEESGGTSGTTMRDMPVIIVTMRGATSGKLRKVPLMRVEHDGEYAAVASKGGAAKNPVWYANLVADPHVEVRDGTIVQTMTAREVTGCLLYTSDAADDLLCVDLGGRRIIKKKKKS